MKNWGVKPKARVWSTNGKSWGSLWGETLVPTAAGDLQYSGLWWAAWLATGALRCRNLQKSGDAGVRCRRPSSAQGCSSYLVTYPRGEGGQASPGRYSTKGQVPQAATPGRRRCSRPPPRQH